MIHHAITLFVIDDRVLYDKLATEEHTVEARYQQ